jgi:hypothetical protein
MNKIKEFISGHIKITFFVCAALLSFTIYAQTIKSDFVYLDDDVLIIELFQTLSDYKEFPSYFYKSVFSSRVDKYFRPVLTASLAADAILGGLNPAAYHQTDILLHIFSVFLIFVFFLRFGFDKKLSFAFCALFAVHPAFVQAVAWIPGRNDTLLCIFVMSALIFLIDYLNTKRGIYLFLHILTFFAALLAKETAVVLTAVIPFIIFLINGSFKNIAIKRLCLFLSLVLALYFSLRYAALHNSRDNIAILGSIKYILNGLPSIFQYCDYLINPSRLSVVPSYIDIDFFSIVSFLIVFGLPFVSSFVFKRGRKSVVIFGFFWFIIFLLPTFILPKNIYFSHRLYLPAAGAIIIWMECLHSVFKDIEPRIKKILFLSFAAVFILFASAAFFHAKKFQNRAVFWANALNDYPFSPFALSNVGLYYYDNKNYDEAEKYFLKAVYLDPSDYRSYNNLGSIYVFRGDAETSGKYFERSLAVKPDNDTALYNLSQLYYVKGDTDRAYELAKKAFDLEPEDAGYKAHYEKIKSLKDRQ